MLQEDPAAMLEIKEDIRDECSKLGQVTNVVLFDKEEDGVASVRFANVEAAVACVKVRPSSVFFPPLPSLLPPSLSSSYSKPTRTYTHFASSFLPSPIEISFNPHH